tara:strand:+ start:907 stop:1548 length:642 start_codon:yes stop_codon:yes gene_type:complete
MGGGGSKQTSILREIDAKLDAQFTTNCNPSAQSIQEILLRDVNIIAKDNCKISFMNKASVNSSCDMGPIIDAIAEMAVSTDQEFAKTLQDAQDRQANAKCEADNCTDKVKVAVTKKLTSACESSSKAQQTMQLTGATIFCDGNSVAEFGNFSEVRATCLRSLLHGGVEEVSSEGTGNLGRSSSSSSSSSQSLDSDMMIMGALALFTVIILTKK